MNKNKLLGVVFMISSFVMPNIMSHIGELVNDYVFKIVLFVNKNNPKYYTWVDIDGVKTKVMKVSGTFAMHPGPLYGFIFGVVIGVLLFILAVVFFIKSGKNVGTDLNG